MNTPHKYADVIKAWADGETIQYRVKDNSNNDWITLNQTTILDFSDARLEWRIKPQKIKVDYITGLFYNVKKDAYFVHTVTNGYVHPHNGKFIKWLTDWKIEEIEL